MVILFISAICFFRRLELAHDPKVKGIRKYMKGLFNILLNCKLAVVGVTRKACCVEIRAQYLKSSADTVVEIISDLMLNMQQCPVFFVQASFWIIIFVAKKLVSSCFDFWNAQISSS